MNTSNIKNTMTSILNYIKPGINIIAAMVMLLFVYPMQAQTTTYKIDKANAWEDLQSYLPEAKMSGISVSVVLLPPSECPPINPSGSYSEPYRLDYITWAKEIAKLSLRYSNLKAFTIQSLQQNINLGYLKQSTVDSIEIASSSINTKLQFNTSPPNLFYVDKYAKGNGSSWTNAATSLSKLNWSIIGNTPNDTIYISGGTDSTIYMRDYLNALTPTYEVVITKGWETGHNGVVCYETPDFATHNCLQISNSSNLKLTGLSFYYEKMSPNNGVGQLGITSCSYVTIDNCDIRNIGQNEAVLTWYSHHISLTNNYIHTDVNDYSNGQDAIWIGSGKGGHTITGNRIILNGTNAIPHIDGIQMLQEGGTGLTTTIANNLIKSTYQVIFTEDMYSNRFLIYNNVLIDSNFNSGHAIITANTNATSDTTNLTYQIYNNTLVGLGDFASTDVMITAGHIDSLMFKNNIGYFENGGRSIAYFYSGVAAIPFVDMDYNRYYQGSAKYSFTGRVDTTRITTGITFAQWQALGYDIHSDMSIVSFANIWGANISDYKPINGSSCIDTGTRILLFNKDIEGTFRPQGGAWDKGAFEK